MLMYSADCFFLFIKAPQLNEICASHGTFPLFIADEVMTRLGAATRPPWFAANKAGITPDTRLLFEGTSPGGSLPSRRHGLCRHGHLPGTLRNRRRRTFFQLSSFDREFPISLRRTALVPKTEVWGKPNPSRRKGKKRGLAPSQRLRPSICQRFAMNTRIFPECPSQGPGRITDMDLKNLRCRLSVRKLGPKPPVQLSRRPRFLLSIRRLWQPPFTLLAPPYGVGTNGGGLRRVYMNRIEAGPAASSDSS